MANGGWSNDQANTIYLYSATTGLLLLRVDEDGIYYASSAANGAYFEVVTGNGDGDTVIILNPHDSAVAGKTYEGSGAIYAGENVESPTTAYAFTQINSPNYAVGGASSAIILNSQGTDSAVDNSNIILTCSRFLGDNLNEIGQGTLDTYIGSFNTNFTTTETIIDFDLEYRGTMVTTRTYSVTFSTTVQSTVSGDFIRLRIYSSPSKTSIAGATLIADYGHTRIDAVSTAQPVGGISANFQGTPGKFIVLTGQRTGGTGTCSVTSKFSKLEDVTTFPI